MIIGRLRVMVRWMSLPLAMRMFSLPVVVVRQEPIQETAQIVARVAVVQVVFFLLLTFTFLLEHKQSWLVLAERRQQILVLLITRLAATLATLRVSVPTMP
jgi:hypothetical protein